MRTLPILFSLCAVNASAQNLVRDNLEAIYAGDSRHQPFEMSAPVQQVSDSVAAQIPKEKLKITGDSALLQSVSLSRMHNFCSTVRFGTEIVGAKCTGFLVAPDILATAGHCFKTDADCTDFAWVFGYQLKNAADKSYLNFEQNNVYNCKKLVAKKIQSLTQGIDYALIQLDRPVQNHQVLALDFDNNINLGDSIYTIGYPSGLPQKIADDSVVLSFGLPNSFDSNLDTFHGNSGSPVFNATTNKVIGIVYQGNADYVASGGGTCKVLKTCKSDSTNCVPSTASKINVIKSDLDLILGQ